MVKSEIVKVVKEVLNEVLTTEGGHESDLFPDSLVERIADAALAFGVTEKTAELVVCDLLDLAADVMINPDNWICEEKDLKSGSGLHEKEMIIRLRPEIAEVHIIYHYVNGTGVRQVTEVSSENEFAKYHVTEVITSWPGWVVRLS